MKNFLLLVLIFCSTSLPLLAQSAKSTHYALAISGEEKGIIDQHGKLILPVEFSNIYSFNEGLVAVSKGGYYNDDYDFVGGQWGFYNQEGRQVIPLQYEDAQDFSEGLAGVKKNGKYGFIDAKNQVKIPFQYDQVMSFSDGKALVKTADKWGLIDTRGNKILAPVYDRLEPLGHGLFQVYHRSKTMGEFGSDEYEEYGTFGIIDASGKLVLDTIYDYVGSFQEGYAYVFKDELYGFIDSTGSVAIPVEYEDVYNFSEGLAAVAKTTEGQDYPHYGFINTKGELIIPYQFDYTESFINGIAMVEKGYYDYGFMNEESEASIFSWGKNNSGLTPSESGYNCIDRQGNFLLEQFYSNVLREPVDSIIICENAIGYTAFSEKLIKLSPSGFSSLDYLGDGYFVAYEPGSTDLILHKQGKKAALKSYFTMLRAGFQDHFVAEVITDLSKDDLGKKYGLINSKGQWLLSPRYSYIGYFQPFASEE